MSSVHVRQLPPGAPSRRLAALGVGSVARAGGGGDLRHADVHWRRRGAVVRALPQMSSLGLQGLNFLQTCPSWNSLAEKRLKNGATMSKCVRGDEAALGLKTEIAGIVDEENPRSAAP